MFKIDIVQTGTSPNKFWDDSQMQLAALKSRLPVIAEQAADHMKQVISASKKDSSGNLGPKKKPNQLEDSIKVKKINNDSYGVVSDSPYWYLINYGGMPRFGGRYHLTPGQMYNSGGGFLFNYDANSPTLMGLPSGLKPNVPIHPMNYIEKTETWLSILFKETVFTGFLRPSSLLPKFR